MSQFLANRMAFFNRRDYDQSDFAGSLFYAKNIPALWIRPSNETLSNKLMIYYYGNASTLRMCHTMLRKLRDRFNCHTMAHEYPSYGLSRSTLLTIRELKQSIRDFITFVVSELHFKLSDIVIVSYCIGGGPAFIAASEFEVAALVSVSPLASMETYMRDESYTIAVSGIWPEFMNNIECAKRVRCPSLIVQGFDDITSTKSQVAAIFQHINCPRKYMMRYKKEKHVMRWERTVLPAMTTFFEMIGMQFSCNDNNNSNNSDDIYKREPVEHYREHFYPSNDPMWPVLTKHYSIWLLYLTVFLYMIHCCIMHD